MAEIYKQQVATQNVNAPELKPFENKAGEQLQSIAGKFSELGSQEETTAKKSYALAMKNEAKKNMDELYSKYLNDPKTLASELDKTGNDLYDTIQDDEVKQDFLVDYELKKGSYVNKAQLNFAKVEQEKYESQTFDNVYTNIKNMGLSLGNGISGKGNDSDFVNYQFSRDNALAQIDAKNADGTNIFTNAQRLQMKNDIDKNLLDSFKASYDTMSKSERKNFADKMANNQVSIGRVKDEMGNFSPAFISQHLDPNLYGDMKKYVKEVKEKDMENELREWNTQKRYAQMNFLKNPTQTNFDNLIKINPDLSENTVDRYTDMIKIPTNFKAETNYQNIEEAKKGITDLAILPTADEKDNVDILDKTSEYVYNLKKANEKGKISADDMQKQSDLAYRVANDKTFRGQVEEIYGQPSVWDKIKGWVLSGSTADVPVYKKVEQLGLETVQRTTDLLLNNDIEGAKKLWAENQRKALRIRYGKYVNFDEVERLHNEGKPAIFFMNNKAFKFAGYGVDDILVEVDPQTGAKK